MLARQRDKVQAARVARGLPPTRKRTEPATMELPLHRLITPEIAAILDQDYEVSTVKVSVAYASGSEDGWGLSDSHPHH